MRFMKITIETILDNSLQTIYTIVKIIKILIRQHWSKLAISKLLFRMRQLVLQIAMA